VEEERCGCIDHWIAVKPLVFDVCTVEIKQLLGEFEASHHGCARHRLTPD
jgi:hypothetical protein